MSINKEKLEKLIREELDSVLSEVNMIGIANASSEWRGLLRDVVEKVKVMDLSEYGLPETNLYEAGIYTSNGSKTGVIELKWTKLDTDEQFND